MNNQNVDTTQITHISLCSGYGGIDLGLRSVFPSLRTVAYAEIEAFAIECLLARMEGGQLDAAPIWSDLKSFPWEKFSGMVDILSGGYPCQPFSAAGKRLGTEDPRHLWPYIANGIKLMQPRVCFFENVEGHISLGLREVISDLESLGYKATWGIFSASEVGASHQRKRVFILAVASGIGSAAGLSRSITRYEGITGIADNCSAQDIWPSARENVGHSGSERCQQGKCDVGSEQKSSRTREVSGARDTWPSRPGEPQYAWEPPRVVGDTKNRRGREGRNANSQGERCGAARPSQSNGKWNKAQSSLGGDADGAGSGLGDAIVFASDCKPCECCDDVICWKCGGHYADCPCPGPNSNDD